MSALEVTATWLGGYAATVEGRGHEVAVDEPAHAGGEDAGLMPTELLCAALASCFCLALGHVAGKRDLDLPGLRVHVRAERLAMLAVRARRVCWVSNTLATPPAVEYRTTSEEGSTRLEV